MRIDAGRDEVHEGTRPRGRLTRLTPAGRPGLAEEEASATSEKAVHQSRREKNDVSPNPEPKSRKAVRGSTTTDAWRGRLKYYSLALLLVAVGVLMRMVLTRLVGPGMPTYITFSPFVMLAALIGGWGPGLLAILATAAVVSYWLLLPPGLFTIERSVDAVGLAFFCVMGILVSLVAELYRRTRDHLDELVSVRTTALSQANEQLQQKVAERKQAEEALRQAKTFTDKLLNAPLDTVFLFEPATGESVRWNKRFAEVSGYSDEEIAGMKAPDDFYDEDDLKKAQECTRRTLADGQGVVELSLITKQGAHIPFEYAGTVVQDEEGRTLLLSVGRDITERKHAEEALKVKDSAIASSLNAIAIADLQGCLTYVNPAFLRLWGYENEREVLGRSVLDFWEEPQRAQEVVQAIQNGGGWTGELGAVKKDGDHLNLYLSASTVLNDEGTPLCMMGAFVDITARKRAEEALRASEARFRALTERSTDVVAIFDPEGKITYISPSIQALFGFAPEEIVGQSLFAFIHPEDAERTQALIAEALREPATTFTTELRTRHKNGEWRWIAVAGRNLMAEAAVGGIVANFQDTTKRKQAEEALRQSEQRYRKLFEANLAGVYLSKLDGTILDCNEAMMRMVGYDLREELVGHRSSDFYVDPESRQEFVHLLQRDGVVPAREIVLRRKDGSILHTFGSAVLMTNEQTGEPYIQGVAIDITQRKQAEESLRELTQTLETKVAQRTAELEHRTRQLQKLTLEMSEAEDRERKRLAEILHDDLQQIMAAAKFHLSVIRDRVKANPSLHAIVLEIDHMLREAIEKSRGLSHELSPAALYGDFAEALDQLANQMQAKHGLVVQVHAAGQVYLQSDAVKAFIYRTAQELLFNAVKHAQVKEARIRVRRLGRYLCLTVSDRGRGFDPQELREAPGFGLLSIRERIELLGGRMNIKSVKGKGSTFYIVVPDGETGGTTSPGLLPATNTDYL